MQAIHFAAIGGYEHIIEKLVKEYGVLPTVEVFMYVLLLAYTNNTISKLISLWINMQSTSSTCYHSEVACYLSEIANC